MAPATIRTVGARASDNMGLMREKQTVFVSNKKCLGCGRYMLYSKTLDEFKCPCAYVQDNCVIVSRLEVEMNKLYGDEPLSLR